MNRALLLCPVCESNQVLTIDSRMMALRYCYGLHLCKPLGPSELKAIGTLLGDLSADDYLVRRRRQECTDCDHRWWTVQINEADLDRLMFAYVDTLEAAAELVEGVEALHGAGVQVAKLRRSLKAKLK